MSVGNGLDRSAGLKPTFVGVGTVKTVPYIFSCVILLTEVLV
jgi:hypothetical protein